MPTTHPELYFPVLVQAVIAIGLAAGLIAASTILGKRARSPLKDTPYESGMAPVGSARERFSVKFYLVGMIFILFDIEAVFLYPWAVVYRQLKLFGFFEMLIFVALVLIGFFYVWKKGALDWSREKPSEPAPLPAVLELADAATTVVQTRPAGSASFGAQMTHPAILETTQPFGETTLIADPAQIVSLCAYLRDTEKFNRISSITAVDWHPAEPRFEVVYHLHSTSENKRVRIKCRLPGAKPEIDSVTSVWRGANWYERETFDMFGVVFRNHPNLVRILMPLDWEGYPLRKDYPVHGYKYGYSNE